MMSEAERPLPSSTLKEGNVLFVEFHPKFTTLLADLKWNNEAKVSALEAKVSYEIKDRFVSVLPKPNDDDYADSVFPTKGFHESTPRGATRPRP